MEVIINRSIPGADTCADGKWEENMGKQCNAAGDLMRQGAKDSSEVFCELSSGELIYLSC